MLQSLHFENIALSTTQDVELGPHLNCITGETGAGKSLMVDGLSLLLGQRADLNLIREGCTKAEVSGLFDIEDNSAVKDFLAQSDLQGDEEGLVIRRVLSSDGKSRSYINGHLTSLSTLRSLGTLLSSVHGQHAAVRLTDPKEQLKLLDSFAMNGKELFEVKEAFKAYHEARSKLTALSEEQKEGAAAFKTMRHELELLKELDLSEGSYEELEKSFDENAKLSALRRVLAECQSLIGDEEGGALDLVGQAQAVLERSQDDKTAGAAGFLQEAASALVSANESMQALSASSQGEDLEALDEKLSRCHELSRRFNVLPGKLYAVQAELEAKLQRFWSLKEEIEKTAAKVKLLRASYEKCEAALHDSRVKAAESLSAKTMELMQTLALEDGRFEVRVSFDESLRPRQSGRDNAAFYFSANVGTALKLLGEAASGGELSRLALAIETITCDQNSVGTIVFDEVDSGISGRTASAVGALLQQIGTSHQVITVTHLPQVAARAHDHFLVKKETVNATVHSSVERLDGKNRCLELARMMGGTNVTQTTLKSAEELLKNSAGS